MTKQIVYAALAAAAFVAAPLSAQSVSPSASTPGQTPAAAETRTVTGCVGAGIDARTFTFTEAVTATSPAADRDATVATAPAPATPWTLVARSDIDLSKYAGKKVELTGMADSKGGASAEKTESTTQSANATTGPRFHVKSVRVLAETCS